MLSHLRTEAYPVYRDAGYVARADASAPLSYDENNARIAAAKRAFEQRSGRVE
jgi:hypothetical protein